jgi:hypothetical protein
MLRELMPRDAQGIVGILIHADAASDVEQAHAAADIEVEEVDIAGSRSRRGRARTRVRIPVMRLPRSPPTATVMVVLPAVLPPG